MLEKKSYNFFFLNISDIISNIFIFYQNNFVILPYNNSFKSKTYFLNIISFFKIFFNTVKIY